LYKKCANFTLVKTKQERGQYQNQFLTNVSFTELKPANTAKSLTEVYWKDCLQEQRSYLHFLQKLAETYENLTNKAKFFR